MNDLQITYTTDVNGTRHFHMPEEARDWVVSYVRETSQKPPAEIASIINEGHAAVMRALDGLSEAQAAHKPAHGDWSALELMGHVVSVKRGLARLTAAMAAGALPPGIGPEFEEERAQDGMSVVTFTSLAEAREAADTEQQNMLKVLDGIESADLKPVFRHFFFGAMNAREWVCFTRVHDGDHIGQLGKIRASAGFPAT